MPLDYGCGLDQYHGVQASRPNPVEPHPEQSICREQPKPPFVLAPEHAHLMSKGNELEFQRGSVTKAEGKRGNEGGQDRDHARNGMAVRRKSLGFAGVSDF